MKKIKFMLLSLSLYAVVGTTLAFKAMFWREYCIAPVQANGTCGVTCPALTNSTTIDAEEFFCTTTPFAGGCKDSHGVLLTCNTSIQLIAE
jgi:hypothetical protein